MHVLDLNISKQTRVAYSSIGACVFAQISSPLQRFLISERRSTIKRSNDKLRFLTTISSEISFSIKSLQGIRYFLFQIAVSNVRDSIVIKISGVIQWIPHKHNTRNVLKWRGFLCWPTHQYREALLLAVSHKQKEIHLHMDFLKTVRKLHETIAASWRIG